MAKIIAVCLGREKGRGKTPVAKALLKEDWGLVGDVHAAEVVALEKKRPEIQKPVIEVKRGDVVVFKLKSMDVVHGFSFAEAGIVVSGGIEPGKVKTVSFVAETAGTFTFSCNAICGDNHQSMQGTLIVRA